MNKIEENNIGANRESISTRQFMVDRVKPAVYESKDVIFAVCLVLCGFLYWELIHFVTLGVGVTIFAIVICMALGVYMKQSGIKQNVKSFICLGLIALSAANFTIFDEDAIKFLNFIFLSGSVIGWICFSTGRSIEGKLSIYNLGDAIGQAFVVPFANFHCCLAAINNGIIKNKHGKGFLSALIGIVIFLPILAAVTSLLTSADVAFEGVMDKLGQLISGNVITYVAEFIFGIPVACYLFGLVYGDVTGRNANHITKAGLDDTAKAMQLVPRASIYAAMIALNFIYLMFFVAQAAYLFSAFGDIIPKAMTYAEYARKGFFELCTVSAINLFVISVAHIFIKKESKTPVMLKIQTIIVSIFTMLLISTALSKMALYIKYYGLTHLRIYTTWFMILLFLIFAIVCVRQLKSFNATRIIIVTFVISFMVLCYGNVDGQIAKYNLGRYEKGTLGMMEESQLNELSDGAVPYLYQIYKVEKEEAVKAMIYSRITGDYGDYFAEDPYEKSYRDFNLQKARGDKIKAEMKKNPPKMIEELRQT